MLRSLNIKNLALVDDAKVGFSDGMNVITGETGAGKSLLIGALRLVLGERADKSMIRSGEISCTVRAEFELSDPEGVNAVLSGIGLDPCADGLLIIRRTLTETSGKAHINDEPVTLQILKRVGDLLVDMHGPYDHQSLLDSGAQLEILDAFGQTGNALEAYRTEYTAMRTIAQQIAALNADSDEELDRRIEFLDYRVAEIDAARLTVEEEREVEEEHGLIAHAQEVVELANGVVNALTEGEGAAFDGLAAAQRGIERLARLTPEAAEWQSEIEQAVSLVQDVVRSIEAMAAGIDAGPERMQWLDDRLTTYRTLKRKYGATVEEVLANGEIWRQQLSELRGRDKRREALQAELDAVMIRVKKAGIALRERRENVADNLSECITRELVDIGFEHGFFDVRLSSCEPGPAGMDEVDFGFAPNAGEEMRPLRMIASSGEISRVMLAVKAVLARHDRVPVLVFDEIDANVGGEIGGAVGRKLAQVARSHQLICITHLPQVAACGTTHLAVEKSVEDGRTRTHVRLLDDAARPEELARMLGGRDSTSVTLDHAREMLRQHAEKT